MPSTLLINFSGTKSLSLMLPTGVDDPKGLSVMHVNTWWDMVHSNISMRGNRFFDNVVIVGKPIDGPAAYQQGFLLGGCNVTPLDVLSIFNPPPKCLAILVPGSAVFKKDFEHVGDYVLCHDTRNWFSAPLLFGYDVAMNLHKSERVSAYKACHDSQYLHPNEARLLLFPPLGHPV